MSETTQIIIGQLTANGLLVGALVYLFKKFGPELFCWLKSKIDEKNGSIGELVAETKRLSQAICSLVQHGNEQQEQFLSDLRAELDRKDQQIDKLIKQIQAALDQAA